MSYHNLNQLQPNKDEYPNYTRADKVTSRSGEITAYFQSLQERLIEHINEADVVIGCVAWLTNFPILDALSKCKGVAIAVQKEDFLRPDMVPQDQYSRWRHDLRHKYERLPSTISGGTGLWDINLPFNALHTINWMQEWYLDGIRCVGGINLNKSPSFPRSHHKFVVFCRIEDANLIEPEQQDLYQHYVESGVVQPNPHKLARPYAVWTGSFNFTQTAMKSFENAVVIRDVDISLGYMHEFAHVYALSEPLDWEATWARPEYELGAS
jgi:hypothetical protein